MKGTEYMKVCVICDKCGKKHSVEIDLDQVDSYERGMGPEIFYEGEAEFICDGCNCGNKINVQIQASEYPEGDEIRVYNSFGSGGQIC